MKTLKNWVLNWYIETKHILKLTLSPAYRKLIRAEDAWCAECEERYKRQEEEAEASWQQHCREVAAEREAEEELFWAEEKKRQDEQYRLQEEAYEYMCEDRRRRKEELDEYGCQYCGELDCICDERVEDSSDPPRVDEDPLPPEYEYWFSRCDKCRQYPEFCTCERRWEWE